MFPISRCIPMVVGFVYVTSFGPSARDRAILALGLIRNDTDAQDYRYWRRIGAVTHSVAWVLDVVVVGCLVMLGVFPLAVTFTGVVLALETLVLRSARKNLRRIVAQCEPRGEVL